MPIIIKTADAYFENGLLSWLATSIIIIACTFIAIKLIRRILRILQKSGKINNTNSLFMGRFISITLSFIAVLGILLQIIPLQKYALSILASSSLLVVFIGFAAQEAFSNLVSGIFISIFKPFTIGDYVTLRAKNLSGTVEDMSLRHTVLRTIENTRIIVPNNIMSQDILENAAFGDVHIRNLLDISISYTSDIDLAKEIIIREAKSHPDFLDNRTDAEKAENMPEIILRVTDLSKTSVDLRAMIWSKDLITGINMLSDLRQSIKKTFDKNGIEIPYPYSNVIIKQDPKSK